MAKKNQSTNLSKAFKDGSLKPELFGSYIEEFVKYRAFYLTNGGKRKWAGPWRTDEGAAKADAWYYAQQGYESGIIQSHG